MHLKLSSAKMAAILSGEGDGLIPYNDVMMSAIASQITSLTIVYSSA